MDKNKKILIVIIMAAAVILIQKLDFDLMTEGELGQVEGASQEEQDLKVIFFDVGQGDSIFIETPLEKQILVDGGEGQLILEKLDKQMGLGDRFIDIVVLSHPHADHLGGLVDVLERYEVGEIWMSGVLHTSNIYLEFLNLIKEKKIPVKIVFGCGIEKLPGCSDEIKIEDKVVFRVLYPLKNLSQERVNKLNHSSVVVRLDYIESSFLLMGDAESPDEEKILENFMAGELEVDTLKAGHHGSSDASSQEFLEAVNPEYAVISVGENSYGHPSLRTLRRMERLGIVFFRTDEQGDVNFATDGENIRIY